MNKLFLSVSLLVHYVIAFQIINNYNKSVIEHQSLSSNSARRQSIPGYKRSVNNDNSIHFHNDRGIKEKVKSKLLGSMSQFSPTVDRYLNTINHVEEEELTKMLTDNKMAAGNPIVTPQELVDTLPAVAWYLRQHKFFEFDHRFYSRPPENSAGFIATFPRPALAYLDKEVEGNCSRGFGACLRLIYSKASQSAFFTHSSHDIMTRVRMHDDRTLLHGGFPTEIHQFIFRVSAAYYMCWFTIHRQEELRHLTVVCRSGFHPHDTSLGTDYRSDDSIPFGCALLSFCPDPCYGRHVHQADQEISPPSGVCPSEEVCRFSALNPCRGVGDGTCTIDVKRNRDFRSLMRNKINITCPCDNVRTGFRWSNEFSTCVDREECLEEEVTCQTETQVCRNTVGSYWCACRFGYMYHGSVQGCVRDNSASISIRQPLLDTDVIISLPATSFTLEKFVSFVEELFYLNSANSNNTQLAVLQMLHILLLACVLHR